MDIPVMEDILGQNDAQAEENHKIFDKHNILAINLMGSPGSGKTTLLEQTINNLKGEFAIGVVEGDLFTDKDAERIADHEVPVYQINTNGGCHLDAQMVAEALEQLPLDKLDLVIVENVGNLVCPAEFNIGEDFKVTTLSITEGDDKPLKYPIIFKESKVAILNKVDIIPFTNFNLENATEDLLTIHPNIEIFTTVATKADDEGMQKWCAYLADAIRKKQGK